MNKLVVVGVFVALVAGLANGQQSNSNQIDFRALNYYLGDNIANAYLTFLEKNIDSLQGGAKNAGQLALDLNNVGDECNNHVLAMMQQMNDAKLRVNRLYIADAVMMAGRKRAEQVCNQYIQQNYQQADEQKTKFADRFQSIFEYGRPVVRLIIESIKNQSEGVPEAQFKDAQTGKKDKSKFEYALNTHLLEPCQQVVAPDQMLDNILAITLERSKDGRRPFEVDIDFELKNLYWRKEVCEFLLDMDSNTKDRLFELA